MNATQRWMIAAAGVAVAAALASSFAWRTPPTPTPARVAETVVPAPPPPTRHREADVAPEAPAVVPGFIVRVVDRETRKPVVGAAVELWSDGHALTATTDAVGAAHLPGSVPVGADRLRIRAPGRRTEDVAASEKVFSGDEPLAIGFHPGTTVEGVVLESEGRPIAGAHVEAMTLHAEGIDEFGLPEPGLPPLNEATTAADGAFRLDGLPANFKSGLVFTALHHVRRGIVWTQDAPSPMEVRLATGGRIRGVVRDPSGAPAADSGVGAAPSESVDVTLYAWQMDLYARTDAEGRYEIDGVPLDCAWTVTAWKEGFADSTGVPCAALAASSPEASVDLALRNMARISVLVLDPSGAPAATARVRYVLGADSNADDVDAAGRCEFELKKSGACRLTADAGGVGTGAVDSEFVVGRTTSVTIHLVRGEALAGVVVDDLGAPVVGATVEVSADAVRRKATSDASGTYRVEALPTGRFSVSASADDHEKFTVEDVDATPLQITLRRDGRVSLRPRIPADAPRPESWNFAWHKTGESFTEGASRHDWSDDGSTIPVPPGKWDVYVELDDYVHVRRSIDVAPGETTTLGEIVLEPGVTLVGRVVDAKGRGIPEVRVECCFRYERSDETGEFKIKHVVAGPQQVEVESDDFLSATVVHAVGADATPFVVTLTHGGRLRGFVHVAAGKPVSDVEVVVLRDGATAASPVVYEDGTFDTRLPAGRYRVIAKRGDATLATKDVELIDGGDTPLDIAIGR